MPRFVERIRPFQTPVLVLLALLLLLWAMRGTLHATEPRRVPYSELAADVDAGKVKDAEFRADEILATLTPAPGKTTGETLLAERIPNMDERALLEAMERQQVTTTGHPEKNQWWWGPLLWLLPLLALPLLFRFLMAGGAGRARPMTFGRSKAKLYDHSAENKTTFADVAGVDEAKAELVEIVRYLKEPGRYRKVGARVPKGVLLVGAPGTGKTLLARAVAGESGAPFFTMSGSEFVEMFVGVGASRVRDLFEQGKQRAPCIVFIDELDAIGKARAGASGFVANEEREQTLNQLLVEMDGFDSGSGVVIMAATNRPEVLDRALLRAGRFDRQVLVDRPDVRGREAILRVHARRIMVAPGVDLKLVAQRTPGMVGADLENVVNEAALAAVRRDAELVELQDFEEAIDRIQLGLKKEGRVMNDEEKRRVAFHESGHALVALSMPRADPVHRITIIPRSVGALGATLQLPTEERYMMTREELRERISVLLGGRSAEEMSCQDVSTGGEDDLERATELARLMVCRFGMSDKLGPLTFQRGPAARLLMPRELGEGRTYSEATARLIDAEVRVLIETEHERARRVLAARRDALEALARELLVKETLTRAEIDEVLQETSAPRHEGSSVRITLPASSASTQGAPR